MPSMSNNTLQRIAEFEVLVKALNLDAKKWYKIKLLDISGDSKISFIDSSIYLSDYDAQVKQLMIEKGDYPELAQQRFIIEMTLEKKVETIDEDELYSAKDVMIAEDNMRLFMDNLSEPLDDSLIVDRILDERKKLGLLDPRS